MALYAMSGPQSANYATALYQLCWSLWPFWSVGRLCQNVLGHGHGHCHCHCMRAKIFVSFVFMVVAAVVIVRANKN